MKYSYLLLVAKLCDFKSIIALVLVATAVVGCGKSTPTCIDESTVTLVKQAFEEALEKELSTGGGDPALLERVKKRIQIAITTIRTSNKDDKIGKVSCDASLQITLANADQIVADPVFKALKNRKSIPESIKTDGPAWSTEIQYTAQHTDDTKNLLIELTGHAPMTSLLSTLANTGVMDPKLPKSELPSDLLAAGNAREASIRLMNHIYGKQDKRGCWMSMFEDLPFCMKLAQSEIKTLAGGKRLYAIATGQALEQNGEPMIVHTMQGLVGAFIVGETNGKAAIISQSTKIQAGTMGSAPIKWTMKELGANSNWGWQSEYEDCHQGYCGTRTVILANRAGAVEQVGEITTAYDDTGACGEDACAAKSSSLKSTVSVDQLPQNAEFYNLLITVTGTSNGKDLESKTWTLPYDSAKHTYTEPADWPLADRDF